MGWGKVASIVAMLLSVPIASAQVGKTQSTHTNPFETAKHTKLGRLEPFAVASASNVIGATLVTFYADKLPSADRRADTWVYFARRTVVHLSKPAEPIRYADSRTCDALTEALKAAERLETPRIYPPGLATSQMSFQFDGTTSRIWSMYPDLEFSSGEETPLGRWTEQWFGRLDRCWSDKTPAG